MPGFHYRIEDVRNIGEAHGFRLLSNDFFGMHRKHYWQCAKGHLFWKKPYDIKQTKSNRGCRQCWHEVQKQPVKDIDYAHELARSRGFKFISKFFLGTKYK